MYTDEQLQQRLLELAEAITHHMRLEVRRNGVEAHLSLGDYNFSITRKQGRVGVSLIEAIMQMKAVVQTINARKGDDSQPPVPEWLLGIHSEDRRDDN